MPGMFARTAATRWLAIGLILAACVGCDQATKHVAMSRLKGQPPQSFYADLLRLEYAENPGAFLGLGGGMPPAIRWTLLVGVNCLLAVAIAVALVVGKRMTVLGLAACGLLLAGAIGNLIDRVRFDGLVIDFLNVGIGPLRTGIFNVADLALMAGAFLLLVPAVSRPSAPPAAAANG
jgi:signal peptidase II